MSGRRAEYRLWVAAFVMVWLSLPTWSSAALETTSDQDLIKQVITDLGFQPTVLIERVRHFSDIPERASIQNRLSHCIDRYAARIATDSRFHEKVVSRIDQRACALLQLCRTPDGPQIDQSSTYAELLRVVASEMRGKRLAESNPLFVEHESFVQFGRHLATVSSIERNFLEAANVAGEVSAPYILDSCPDWWKSWPILLSGLMLVCLLGGVLAFLLRRPHGPRAISQV